MPQQASPSGQPRFESPAWVLPLVPLKCPKCRTGFQAPDLRREKLQAHKVPCPNCDRILNRTYKKALRDLDEAEHILLPSGRRVLTRVQLFLLEASLVMGDTGTIQSRRVMEARLDCAAVLLRAAHSLGLLGLESRNASSSRYTLTSEGRRVVRLAHARYARSRIPSTPEPTRGVA